MTQPTITSETLDAIRDLEPSRNAQPVDRLLLAVLQQAVLDYFTGSEKQQRDALRYFRESVLYRLTLQLFDLPPDALPQGVQLDSIPERTRSDRSAATDTMLEATLEDLDLNGHTISLFNLMQLLKGNRLHVFLTIHLLEQPVSITDVVLVSGISEDTVRRQMGELQEMGLLDRVRTAETHKSWVVSNQAVAIIAAQTD